MSHRPRLSRHIRVLRRAEDSVQIGPGTSEGIVLDHLSDLEFAYLTSLDTRSRAPMPPAPSRAGELLMLLEHNGLLQRRGETPSHGHSDGRTLPRIAVEGAGSLVPAIRSGLAEVGYRIAPASHPRGVSPTAGGASSLSRGLAKRADLAILVDRGGVPFLTGEPWRRAGVPHIPVVFDGPRVSVGPVIDSAGPCLRCLDLTRCDQDPSWPMVLAQVAGYDATDSEEAPHTPDDIVVLRLAVAVALSAVHSLVSGADRAPFSVPSVVTAPRPYSSTTWRLPGPQIELHEWHVHPRCPVHAASATMEQ